MQEKQEYDLKLFTNEKGETVGIKVPKGEEYPYELFINLLNSNVMQNIMQPMFYEYNLTAQLFIDIWGKYGSPSELVEDKEIFEFLQELILKSEGNLILDHFSLVNYDFIHSIEYKDSIFEICWRNFEGFEEKYQNRQLNNSEFILWESLEYTTTKMLCHINKLRFIESDDGLKIFVLTNLIPQKKVENFLNNKNEKILNTEINKAELYMKYDSENENEDKITYFINNLPYYSFLIQPKEKSCTKEESKRILLEETFNEIFKRMHTVKTKLENIEEYDYDEISSKGNIIRKIIEYTFKFLCIYKEIKLNNDIYNQYGHVNLGDLRKKINNSDITDINIEQELINQANNLSHDSGEIFEKDYVLNFWEEANNKIIDIRTDLIRN